MRYLSAMGAVGVIALTACSDPQAQAKGAAIVAAAKAATGGSAWDEIEIWHERGEFHPAGQQQSMRFEHWGDLRTLKARNMNSAHARYMLFDGRSVYFCTNPECDPAEMMDGKIVRSGEYRVAYGFYFPERFPATFEYDRSQTEGDRTFDIVKVSPVDLEPLELWIDRATHRIARTIYQGGSTRADYSSYRKVGSVVVPFVIEENGSIVRTESVTFEPGDSVRFTPSGP